MKKLNKLVALLLAAVMVLGMMPVSVSAAQHDHIHTASVEEYPALELDVELEVTLEAGTPSYVTFTPAYSGTFRFVSLSDGDTKATLRDAEMNSLVYSDDCYVSDHGHTSSRNFCVTYDLTVGQTYILENQFYYGTAGTYNVLVTHIHNYVGEVTTPYSCTEDGVMTYSCACGEVEPYTEVIAAHHDYDLETGKCIYCNNDYEVSGQCGDDLYWSMDWSGTLTISGTGDMYNYLVSYGEDSNPAPWYDYKDNKDDGMPYLQSVVVEDGCTSIGNYAFYYCQNVTEFSLPDSVTSLGENAFNSCYGMTEFTIPANVTELPTSCFASCGALNIVNWNEKLTTIGSNAFNYCDLGDLVLPEGITTIGQSAFTGNSDMSTLTLPSTLTTLANYGFSRMWNTTTFVFTGDAPTTGDETNAMGDYTFQWVTANVWYPADNATWTDVIGQNYGGTLTWKPMCAEHSYGQPEKTEATCEVGEFYTATCTTCGWVIYNYTSEPLGHDLVETLVEPDCSRYQNGGTEITCSREGCSYYNFIVDESKYYWNSHTPETVTVEATCTTSGYTEERCSKCGNTTSYVSLPATGHNVTEWSEPTAATCTADGVKTGDCSNCYETVTEVVETALGHEWNMEAGTENEDGTITYPCTRCDATYTTEGDYLYVGTNEFTLDVQVETRTKTFIATESGNVTFDINTMTYYNRWSETWNPYAIDSSFSDGCCTMAINGEAVSYTVEGQYNDAHLIVPAVAVEADDEVTLTINHVAENYYTWGNAIKFNVDVTFEAVTPETDVELTVGETATYDHAAEDEVITEPDASVATMEIAAVGGTEATIGEGTTSVDAITTGQYVIYHNCSGSDTDGDMYVTDSIFNENYIDLDYETYAVWTVTVADGVTYIQNSEGKYLTVDNGTAGLTETATAITLTHMDASGADQEGLLITANGFNLNCQGCGHRSETGVTDSYAQGKGGTGGWSRWAIAPYTEGTPATGKTVTFTGVAAGETTAQIGNMIYNITVTVPHEHSYTAVVHEATCTEYGYTEYVCKCGESYIDDDSWTEPEHKWDDGVVTAPTCTEQGYTTFTCTACGESYIDEDSYTPATGHVYDDDADTICNVCGEEREVEVDPADPWGKSKWVKVEVDTETIWNETEGNFEYAWDDNTDTIWHSDWKTAQDVLTGENTFSGTIDFTREYYINQFSFLPRQDYTYWENGSGVILQASLYVKDADDTEWTCVAEHATFDHNQELKTFYFEAQNVRYVKLVAEKSSYMAEGQGWVAVAEFYIDYVPVTPCEHTNTETRNASEATCTADGYTGDCYCVDCGEKLGNGEVIPATGHTANDAVMENVVEATCTEAGSYDSVVYCSICDTEISRETIETDPALGHDWTDATCTAPKTCSVCGATEGEALGHDYINGVCSRCDAVKDSPFEDVPAGQFYFDPVEWAVEKGITTGATETLFDPEGQCLRAHVVTFLWRAAGSPEPTSTYNPFSDVTENDFFYKAVLWAVENGITNGTSATEFSPYKECNRAQVVTFLWRSQGEPESTAEVTFTDVEEGQFYTTAVAWAVENEITNGMGDGTFGVEGICNRAQVVTFLYRTMAE